MAGDEDVTLGELGRRITDLAAEIRQMPTSYVSIRVWEVERAALEEQRRTMGREIAQLRTRIETMETEKDAEHKAFTVELARQEKEARIERERIERESKHRDQAATDKAATAAEQARKDRNRNWFAIGLVALAGVITLIVGLANSALGGLA